MPSRVRNILTISGNAVSPIWPSLTFDDDLQSNFNYWIKIEVWWTLQCRVCAVVPNSGAMAREEQGTWASTPPTCWLFTAFPTVTIMLSEPALYVWGWGTGTSQHNWTIFLSKQTNVLYYLRIFVSLILLKLSSITTLGSTLKEVSNRYVKCFLCTSRHCSLHTKKRFWSASWVKYNRWISHILKQDLAQQ